MTTTTVSAALPPQLTAAAAQVPSTPERLAQTVAAIAARPDFWQPLVRFGEQERYRVRLAGIDDIDLWLITWRTFSTTELHDHARSEGAFTVVSGALTEIRPINGRLIPRRFIPGLVHNVDAGQVHDVRNELSEPAVSLHAYSPRLAVQNFYDWRDGAITHLRTEIEPC